MPSKAKFSENTQNSRSFFQAVSKGEDVVLVGLTLAHRDQRGRRHELRKPDLQGTSEGRRKGHVRQTAYEHQDHGERKRNPCRNRTRTRAFPRLSQCSRNDNEQLVSSLSGVANFSARWFIKPLFGHQDLDGQAMDTMSATLRACVLNAFRHSLTVRHVAHQTVARPSPVRKRYTTHADGGAKYESRRARQGSLLSHHVVTKKSCAGSMPSARTYIGSAQ